MLIVKTKLGLSSKRGIGLFADQNIPKGTIVGLNKENLSIICYAEEQWENLKNNLNEESFNQIKRFTTKNKLGGLYYLNLDNTRFINHSNDPNIATIGDDDIAIKDINSGEEILIDYTTYYDPIYFQEIIKMS